MREELVDGLSVEDRRDVSQPRAAIGAREHVQTEPPSHELGPGGVWPFPAVRLGFCVGGEKMGRLFEANHTFATDCVATKDSMINDAVDPGPGDHCRELLDKFLGLEGEVRGSVWAGGRQPEDEELAIVFEAVFGDRWAQEVSAGFFEALSVVLRDGTLGVEVEAPYLGAPFASPAALVHRCSRAKPVRFLSSTMPGSEKLADRSVVELVQGRYIILGMLRRQVGFGTDESQAFEEGEDSFVDLGGHSEEGVWGRRQCSVEVEASVVIGREGSIDGQAVEMDVCVGGRSNSLDNRHGPRARILMAVTASLVGQMPQEHSREDL